MDLNDPMHAGIWDPDKLTPTGGTDDYFLEFLFGELEQHVPGLLDFRRGVLMAGIPGRTARLPADPGRNPGRRLHARGWVWRKRGHRSANDWAGSGVVYRLW